MQFCLCPDEIQHEKRGRLVSPISGWPVIIITELQLSMHRSANILAFWRGCCILDGQEAAVASTVVEPGVLGQINLNIQI